MPAETDAGRRPCTILAVVLASTVTTACGGSSTHSPGETAPPPTASAEGNGSGGESPLAAPQTRRSSNRNLLQPGDAVKLFIWREPDLSGNYAVDEDGAVVFPMIGSREVTGLHPDSLRNELVRDYQVYLKNPSIDVTLLRRVHVSGAVRNPGLYPVDPTITIAGAVAMAGGPTQDGKLDEVMVQRGGRTVVARIGPEMRVADTPIQSGDQLFVPEKGWFARNTGVAASIFSSVFSATISAIAIISTR